MVLYMRLYRIVSAALFAVLMLGTAIAAGPGGTIRGKVTYTDGSPVVGATLVYRHSSDPQKSRQETQTNDKGEYEFANAATGVSAGPDDPFASGGSVRVASAPKVATHVLPPAAELELQPGQTAQRDFSLRGNITIAGQVIDTRTGKPLAGAQLTAALQSPVTCDDQGRFSFESPAGSEINLYVGATSSRSTIIDRDRTGSGLGFKTLSPTVDVKDLVIKVRTVPARTLRGVVVDSAGVPVANAMVGAEMQYERTSADGKFEIAVAANRPTYVSASEGSRSAVVKVSDEEEIRLPLRDPVTRTCLVLCPDGSPASDLSFSYMPEESEAFVFGGYGSAKTDSRGECTLAELTPGVAYTAIWSGDNESNRDYDSGQARFVCKADDEGPIRFTAVRYVNALLGRVVDEAGKPVAGASVAPTGTKLMRPIGKTDMETAEDGTFEISMLGGGTIDLVIRASGYRPAFYQAKTDDVDFAAVMRKPEASFLRQVALVDELGAPVPGASVFVRVERDKARQISAGPDGMVALPEMDERTMAAILCVAPGFSPQATARRGNVAGTQHVTMEKLQGEYALRVEAEDGTLLEGATVRIRDLMGPVGGGSRASSGNLAWADDVTPLLTARTGADGIATFAQVGRNDVAEVEVTAPDGTVTIDNPQNMLHALPTVRCGRPASLIGRLIAPADAPAPKGLSVSLRGPSLEVAKADPGGNFEFPKLKPGEYILEVTGGSSKLPYGLPDGVEVELESGEAETLDVPLKKMLVIGGTVEGAAEDVAGASVSVQRGDFYRYISPTEGKWEVLVPGAGTYRLSYSTPTDSSRAGQVTIGESENKIDIVIKVKPAGGR